MSMNSVSAKDRPIHSLRSAHAGKGDMVLELSYYFSAPSMSLIEGRSLSSVCYLLNVCLFTAQPAAASSMGPYASTVNVELSPVSSDGDRPLGLSAPLRHEELEVEQGLHGLLEW